MYGCLDISAPIAEAVASRKTPNMANIVDILCKKRPAAARKQAAEPSRGEVLNTIASMTGSSSGGKQKVISKMGDKGFKKAATKRTLSKLLQEKALFSSQTKRKLSIGKHTWRALRTNPEKLQAARMFKL